MLEFACGLDALVLDFDVMAQRRLVPVALVAAVDGALEQPLNLVGLPPVVALLFGQSWDEKLHA